MALNFIADVMLGKLARWLRILGYPTEYSKTEDDDQLIRLAMQKNAILLTRDERLAEKAQAYCKIKLLKANALQGQLRELLQLIRIPKRLAQKICAACNGPVKRVKTESVKNLVWPRVYKSQKRFWQCAKCGQVYWKGSHAREIGKTLQKLAD